MRQRIWNKFLTERDKAVFAAGGFGARAGFGKRPALLVIDVNWAFSGERPEPILQSSTLLNHRGDAPELPTGLGYGVLYHPGAARAGGHKASTFKPRDVGDGMVAD